jgi:hypothetical protein
MEGFAFIKVQLIAEEETCLLTIVPRGVVGRKRNPCERSSPKSAEMAMYVSIAFTGHRAGF